MRAGHAAAGAALARAGATVLDDPLAALRGLAVDALTRLATDPRTQAVFEIVFHKCELVGELGPIATRRDRERCDCLTHVESIVELAVEEGQLPADTDTRLATKTMHAYMGGIMREWVLDPAAFDLARAAPALIDALVAGLRAAPPRRVDERVRPRASPRAAVA